MTPAPAAVAPATVTSAYEHLRAWAGGLAPPGPRPPGLALLLQRGLAAWLTTTTAERPPPTGSALTPPVGTAATVAAGEVAYVLATMVAAWQQEVSR